jgi:hypothetical protein
MATIQDVLDTYQELCRFCDSTWMNVQERYPNDLQCGKGCCGCCELESISALETYIIRGFLDRQSIRLEEPASASTKDQCPLLSSGLCTIYPARPLICRTHGLPIRSTSLTEGAIDCCPLNFPDEELQNIDRNIVLDVDVVTDNLMRLNMAFCMLLGEKNLSSERFFLRDILAGTIPELLKQSKTISNNCQCNNHP